MLHLGVFDISEARHRGLQQRRRDPEALFAFLAEQRIPAGVNHLFSALTGKRETADLHLPMGRLELIEARNGMMPPSTNAFALAAGRASGMAPIGGSDAHTLAQVAHAYTVVPGARDKQEFLEGLRRGLTVPAGGAGSYARLTADVLRVAAGTYRDAARSAARDLASAARFAILLGGAPVLALVPLVTAALHVRELLFAAAQQRRFVASGSARLRPRRASGPIGPAPAGTLA
jgi:hypothetical protein